MKFKRTPKQVAIIGTLLLMLIAVPVVYGGIQWSGFDPQVQIDGTQYNVTVFGPDKTWCDSGGDIDVTFYVEEGATTELDFESSGGPAECRVTTDTIFVERDGQVGVDAEVTVAANGKGRSPVVVEIASDGESAVCRGVAGKPVTCSLDN